MKGLLSWFFSRLPESVKSGRLLLKNPKYQSNIMIITRTNMPTMTDTMMTQDGTCDDSVILKSGYAKVST